MKKIFMLFSIVILIGNMSVQAKSLTIEEKQKWKKAGISSNYEMNKWKSHGIELDEAKEWMIIGFNHKKLRDIDSWKRTGVSKPKDVNNWKKLGVRYYNVKKYLKNDITPEILKPWNEIGVQGLGMLVFKKNGINTPKETKAWKDEGISLSSIISYISNGINTPQEARKWKDAGIPIINIPDWRKLGVNTLEEIKEWREVVRDVEYAKEWIIRGILTSQKVKMWKSIGKNYYGAYEAKRSNIGIDTILEWNKIGIKKIKNIKLLTDGGFKTSKEYEPYKGVYLEDAVKLKKWNILPDKLIKSMSYSNTVFGKELYFTNKKIFQKAYLLINKHCDVIEKDKWFSKVDVNTTKKCYVFAAKMIQRIDSKPFFGEPTQNGLVSGLAKHYFYVEDFKGNWSEDNTKLGIAKGNGIYTYESNRGKQTVLKGSIIYIK